MLGRRVQEVSRTLQLQVPMGASRYRSPPGLYRVTGPSPEYQNGKRDFITRHLVRVVERDQTKLDVGLHREGNRLSHVPRLEEMSANRYGCSRCRTH
jgi:hypothetical protein